MTVLKTSLRNFLAHKGRMALSAVAVLLSVAFVCGTLVFTDTMNATFDKLFANTASDVSVGPEKNDDAQATGRPATVPASLREKLAKVDGVAKVEPSANSRQLTVVDGRKKNLSPTSGAPTVGTNWDESQKKSVEITSGHEPHGPAEAVLDSDTADKHGVRTGDTLRVIAAPGDFTVKVVGIATYKTTNPGAAVLYFDTPTAQAKLLGSTDAFSGYGLTAASGVSDEQLKERVSAALGSSAGDYALRTAAESKEENKKDVGSFLDVMKYALLGFAGIAVLVGVFLIVNTFSMLVAQRTREIGLMRAIGSSRPQIMRSVLVEAVLLGVVGSVLGIGGGVALAVGLMELMGSMGMKLDTSELTIKATTPVVGLVIGVFVTLLASCLPAFKATKISPMAALRDAGTPADGKAGKVRTVIGLVLTAAGGLALVAAAKADTAAAGSGMLGLGVLLTLVGFVVVGPLLAGLVVRVISAVVLRVFGPVGRLAERNALRNPRRTGATASALMIGLALVAALSVVGSSMVASATEQLDKSVGADFIIQNENEQPLSPAQSKAIRSAGDVAHLTPITTVNAKLTLPDGKTVKQGLNASVATYGEDLATETVQGRFAEVWGKDAMSVPEGFAKDHGIKLGDKLTVAMVEGRTAGLRVKAITSDDTSINKGGMFLALDTARQYLPADKMPLDMLVFAKAADGKAKEAAESLKAAVADYPQIKVRDQADYKKLIKDQVGRLLNMIYGLLGLAIVVAVLGVVNTLALSVVERTREIGLLRAIGLSRRQMRRMIRLESVVIALFGALLGLGLGMAWGTTAQKLLALQGLGVLDIPWPTITTVFLGSAVVGLLAALVPAFRAGRMNVLKAIATD
ncbi:membrane protein [Streptomyces eurocidicus]|uniref:Membrane protein n=1 Tax=Streptomyces eurocidicus TaxID=66423 RepID=A0A2N8NSX0_STREU|nr:FtsX-like permease family protein [Streptomyces eurocidicus]MBB5120102.1 putative ABC transport system permease protein [Streptomyces eurocidicus]MBF6056421.1 FtsX-like permease family protein [Streptomyces eurocidicus]PNE31870.1 membrane protein [Streptomyces eurocidicus]